MDKRVAVVSGGGTGIGAATARAFAMDGYDVVIVGRRAEVLDATATRVDAECGRPGAVRSVTADLTDPDQVERVVAALDGRTVDVLVNNAGGYLGQQAETLAGAAAFWRSNFDANVLTAVLLTEA
ncbi:SDR family NAD(P)-dependent oxidoreductase, partial [Micromonospora azadirachtae]